MGNQDQILSLFPTPVMICSYPFDYSKELEWINKQECNKDNRNTTSGMGNRQSDDTFILDSVELRRVKTFIETKLRIIGRGMLKLYQTNIITIIVLLLCYL